MNNNNMNNNINNNTNNNRNNELMVIVNKIITTLCARYKNTIKTTFQ